MLAICTVSTLILAVAGTTCFTQNFLGCSCNLQPRSQAPPQLFSFGQPSLHPTSFSSPDSSGAMATTVRCSHNSGITEIATNPFHLPFCSCFTHVRLCSRHSLLFCTASDGRGLKTTQLQVTAGAWRQSFMLLQNFTLKLLTLVNRMNGGKLSANASAVQLPMDKAEPNHSIIVPWRIMIQEREVVVTAAAAMGFHHVSTFWVSLFLEACAS